MKGWVLGRGYSVFERAWVWSWSGLIIMRHKGCIVDQVLVWRLRYCLYAFSYRSACIHSAQDEAHASTGKQYFSYI